ncbi:MAG: hypothetical protein LBR49_05065 [Tannerella sp.]|nr:hypothetical protein [Tannerella sp.]
MVRQVFIPTEGNNSIPFTIPREWYGKQVEFIAFPVVQEEVSDTDFWNSLSLEAKQDIELGISEIANGESIEYEQLMAQYR